MSTSTALRPFHDRQVAPLLPSHSLSASVWGPTRPLMQDDSTTTAQALRLHNELHVLSITFLYWDHLLTFGDEVRFLWRKAKSRSTYYFFLNRYLACFSYIVITVFQFTSVSISVCKHVNLFRQVILVLNQVTICVLLTVRIYALYGRDKRVYIYLLGTGIVLLVVSVWAISGKGGVPQPDAVGCHIATSKEVGIRQAVPWEALLLYDILIFVALFSKSYKTVQESGMMWASIPILSLLMRDGAIYFISMALVNFANILTYYMADPLLRGCLATFAGSLSVTMMSRLMLNLHAVERTGIFSTTTRIVSSPQDSIELDTLRTRDLERSARGSPDRQWSAQAVSGPSGSRF
ncbi:hypothetical protein B0H10DRAFT_2049797 [Mycena sp. CBHHK59/15]|nr:hypothetical protein B0H10DRAFT_2049797 [Mycena sp. CBHHK59/15]